MTKERFQHNRASGIDGSIAMLVTPVITMLCTAGVVFYLRFLFALCKEGSLRLIEYGKRLRPGFREAGPVTRVRSTNKRNPQPVMRRIEIKPNGTFEQFGKDRI
jgi:hypothetical protein